MKKLISFIVFVTCLVSILGISIAIDYKSPCENAVYRNYTTKDAVIAVVWNKTHSMYPTITEKNKIYITKTFSINELKVCDIVTYHNPSVPEKMNDRITMPRNIIHRIVYIGWDEYGWFCITRGDNNQFSDAIWIGKLRFNQINGLVTKVV